MSSQECDEVVTPTRVESHGLALGEHETVPLALESPTPPE